ncbi:MAG TPA: ABC transporter ATP-binding protein [Microbacterium sp.]|uniref:ABC transporter ATP-binding protein n=1 Tax=Microbacterium sp. TaxID=51671 RepID=UPI002B580525|nr:ABC transporter ATP-binding protein [Microbacterium sp.]HWI30035.1 ABC transporter ATP-binding protein [Microbacterium sp.]
MPDVIISGLRKEFAGNVVLQDIDIHIKDGEFFTLLGPSGCGKSTTLSCIAGLERPTDGTIAVGDAVFFDGRKFVPPEERDLGMVFQSYALWPHMTLTQNLAVPLNIRKVPKARQKGLIHDALDKVGLAHLAKRYPHQLSGGQQQRVALARALVYSPKVLLLDEPLSNLDAKLREQARVWLKRLQSELGITTVYVTHDQEEALAMSDRIAVMSNGHLMQVGTPHEIYETPATAEVNAFIGRSNFLHGKVIGSEGGKLRVSLDDSPEEVLLADDGTFGAGAAVTIAFRPERTALAREGQSLPDNEVSLSAEVLATSYVGSRYEYDLKFGNHTLLTDYHRGDLSGRVRVLIPEDAIRIYPKTDVLDADLEELIAVTI